MDNMSDLSSDLSSAAVDTSIANIVINPTKKYYRKTAHRYVLSIRLPQFIFINAIITLLVITLLF